MRGAGAKLRASGKRRRFIRPWMQPQNQSRLYGAGTGYRCESGIIATTKCSCRQNQRFGGDVGFGLQGLWRGGARWFQALPCLRNIETGFTAASICPSAPLARVIAYRVSALVSAAAR
jgi:hypothetical protein